MWSINRIIKAWQDIHDILWYMTFGLNKRNSEVEWKVLPVVRKPSFISRIADWNIFRIGNLVDKTTLSNGPLNESIHRRSHPAGPRGETVDTTAWLIIAAACCFHTSQSVFHEIKTKYVDVKSGEYIPRDVNSYCTWQSDRLADYHVFYL
jgi:hypothetical protein